MCEGDRLRLRCHQNLRIAIYSAAFGATHYGVPECPQPNGEGNIEGEFKVKDFAKCFVFDPLKYAITTTTALELKSTFWKEKLKQS